MEFAALRGCPMMHSTLTIKYRAFYRPIFLYYCAQIHAMRLLISIFILAVMATSCKQDTLPKPKGFLRLEYPSPQYKTWESPYPFAFETNQNSRVKTLHAGALEIRYPKMKATIYLTYKPVQGNLKALLRDAQKLTYDHVIKADQIIEQPFVNPDHKVYGMLYQLQGNAATQAQFYATDSLHHFMQGSVYFYARPNFDSVYPAAVYLKRDVRRLMESLQWK